MARPLIRTATLALCAAALVVPTASAHAATPTNKSCNPKKYKTHYSVTVSKKAPAITHLGTFGIGPGGSRTVKKTVARQRTLAAAVKYSSKGKVEASLPGKILGSASAEVNLSLAANGSRIDSKTTQVTDKISNSTGHNVQYVFYSGATEVKGQFRKYTCQYYYLPGKNYGYYRVYYKAGTWKSYAVRGEGAVRCGAGTKGLGSLARAALKVGCKA